MEHRNNKRGRKGDKKSGGGDARKKKGKFSNSKRRTTNTTTPSPLPSSSPPQQQQPPSPSSSRRRLKMRFDEEDGRLLDREVVIEPPEIPDPSEQEKKIYDALNSSFVLGDDAARAIARFERDVVLPRYRANDESEEEFRKEEMEMTCYHMGHLHMIKTLLPFYGLVDYEREIMGHFVEKAFGKEGGNSGNNRPTSFLHHQSSPHNPPSPSPFQKVFRGDDEQYLEHLAMTTDND